MHRALRSHWAGILVCVLWGCEIILILVIAHREERDSIFVCYGVNVAMSHTSKSSSMRFGS